MQTKEECDTKLDSRTFQISSTTLSMMDSAVENLKSRSVSEPVDPLKFANNPA